MAIARPHDVRPNMSICGCRDRSLVHLIAQSKLCLSLWALGQRPGDPHLYSRSNGDRTPKNILSSGILVIKVSVICCDRQSLAICDRDSWCAKDRSTLACVSSLVSVRPYYVAQSEQRHVLQESINSSKLPPKKEQIACRASLPEGNDLRSWGANLAGFRVLRGDFCLNYCLNAIFPQPSNESGFLNLLFEVRDSACLLGLDYASSFLACMSGLRLVCSGASKGAASIPWKPVSCGRELKVAPCPIQYKEHTSAEFVLDHCLFGSQPVHYRLARSAHRSMKFCGEILAVTDKSAAKIPPQNPPLQLKNLPQNPPENPPVEPPKSAAESAIQTPSRYNRFWQLRVRLLLEVLVRLFLGRFLLSFIVWPRLSDEMHLWSLSWCCWHGEGLWRSFQTAGFTQKYTSFRKNLNIA